MAEADDKDAPVPKLPRTTHFKLISPAAIMRIVLTGTLLTMIIVTRRPCANAVGGFVTSFDGKGSGSAANLMPKPGTVDQATTGSAGDYESLRPDMTEAEMKAAIERAKAKSRAQQGSGSSDGSGGSGSSTTGSGSSSGSATSGGSASGSGSSK